MADTAVDYSDGIGRKQLKTIRERFRCLHKARLELIESELRPGQRIFIELIPLLFHTNHPLLPGFISTETPAGIPQYYPDKDVIRAARSISRSFSYERRAQRQFTILGLYLMGSIGSIGHTRGSDFDVWLCYDPALSEFEREALGQKARRLEIWAGELGLEVHIFMIDVNAFKQGKRDALSHESSGTTQPRLLLEEFYRTAVLLAGRHPLWWLIPPQEEENYSRYAEMLIEKRFVDPSECIDFGGLEAVPADEFFGAAHWQLYKGIQSPYKSILKLLLTEAYAHDYPEIRWLCQEAKDAVYEGTTETTELDPYVLMYRRVEQFLSQRGETKRLELARRCFYFKAEQRLSQLKGKPSRWQGKLLQSLVDEWEWKTEDLIILDSREHWKLDRVQDERNMLVNELIHSYRLLTEFAGTFGHGQSVSPEELNLLGRKLFTAMDKRPGKIDHNNFGISHNLIEHRLTIFHSSRSSGFTWFLYLGEVGEDEVEHHRPVKSCTSLVEILTWCHFNRILESTTVITLYPAGGPVTQAQMQSMLDVIRSLYPLAAEDEEIPIELLSAPPAATSCSIFLNVGTDPMAYLTRVGKQLTTIRSDPLSFGAAHSSLLENMELIIQNSWGETTLQTYEGTDGLFDSLCHFLRSAYGTTDERPAPRVTAHCFTSARASAIAQRLQMLFNDVSHCFGPKGSGTLARYLLQVDQHYYLLQRNENDFSYYYVSTWHELLEVLAESSKQFRPLVMDRFSLTQTPLPVIYQHNLADKIQVFYTINDNFSDIFVLDECGALFHQRLQGTDEHYLLAQQRRFFNGLQMLRTLQFNDSTESSPLQKPEFYRISKDYQGNFIAGKRTLGRQQLPENYFELRVVANSTDLNNDPFVLICGDLEFSSLEQGQTIYRMVAEHMLEKRQNRLSYPIYLTAIELPGSADNQSLSTNQLLQYKKRLEERLNQALQELIRQPQT